MVIPPPAPSTFLLWFLGPLILFFGAAWLISRRRTWETGWLAAALGHRSTPVVAGTASALVTLYVWGSLREPPVIHDEAAYLLQAEILAAGRWVGEVPPLPEFFEQAHVFVEPHLAAKYPPGHSLWLVPGIWLGWPGFMPLLSAALAGGLLFSLARQTGGPGVALLTWAFWSTSGASLTWRASYMSQSTSTVLWLAALWWLLRWVNGGTRACLVLAVAATGWMYLTRPLTAIAVAIPIAFVTVICARRDGRWSDVGRALGAMVPVVALQLIWQKQTLGDWFVSPYAEYSRQYFPFVKPGFGVDPTPPARAVPPEIAWVAEQIRPIHAAHSILALPVILLLRIAAVLWGLGQGWRAWLIFLFLAGSSRATGAHRFALVSAAALIVGYLVYAHPVLWIVYYVEAFPVFFVLAAAGFVHLCRRGLRLADGQMLAACLAVVLLSTPALVSDVRQARGQHDEDSRFQRTAAAVLATIPDEHAVVFVRYPPQHSHHDSLILNTPDFRKAKLWLVYDRGRDNDRLLAITDRPAFRLDTASWGLERLR